MKTKVHGLFEVFIPFVFEHFYNPPTFTDALVAPVAAGQIECRH